MILRILTWLTCICYLPMLWSNVSSLSGDLYFDVDSNGRAEAHLNATGFGIGLSPAANLHLAGNAVITGTLTIGSGTVGADNLRIHGSVGYSISTISTNTLTLGQNRIVFLDSSSGNLQLNLPSASLYPYQNYILKKKVSTNWVSLQAAGNLDVNFGHYMGNVAPHGCVEIFSDGSRWHVLSSFSSVASQANLVAWWPLDEGTGTEIFSSTSSKNGSFENGPTWVSGKYGQALNFVGSSKQAVNLGPMADIGLQATNEYTISLWCKVTSGNTGSFFTKSADDPNAMLRMFCFTNNKLGIIAGKTGGDALFSGNTLADGTWHHCVFTNGADGAGGYRFKGYIDGLPEISGVSGTSSTAFDAMLGQRRSTANNSSDGGFPLTGMLDEIKLFDKCLSASEVWSLYRSYP